MIKYNKHILNIQKKNPLSVLEDKYGKIFTYNYNTIKKYNDMTNDLFDEVNNNNEEKIYGGIEKSKLTLYQRIGQLKIVSYICLGLCILNIFSNVIYIWKLNGIIYPILILIVCINIYIISEEYIKKLSSTLSKKKSPIIKKINIAINIFVGAVRGLPKILPNIPKIENVDSDSKAFKIIRNSVQKLVINVNIDVNKYKIKINVPSLAFNFINPLAAIC